MLQDQSTIGLGKSGSSPPSSCDSLLRGNQSPLCCTVLSRTDPTSLPHSSRPHDDAITCPSVLGTPNDQATPSSPPRLPTPLHPPPHFTPALVRHSSKQPHPRASSPPRPFAQPVLSRTSDPNVSWRRTMPQHLPKVSLGLEHRLLSPRLSCPSHSLTETLPRDTDLPIDARPTSAETLLLSDPDQEPLSHCPRRTLPLARPKQTGKRNSSPTAPGRPWGSPLPFWRKRALGSVHPPVPCPRRAGIPPPLPCPTNPRSFHIPRHRRPRTSFCASPSRPARSC